MNIEEIENEDIEHYKTEIRKSNIGIAHLKNQLKQVKQRLVEKNRELEYLKNDYNHLLSISDIICSNTLKAVKTQCARERYKICDEIRNEFIKQHLVVCGEKTTHEDIITTGTYNECLNDLKEYLKQIEKESRYESK